MKGSEPLSLHPQTAHGGCHSKGVLALHFATHSTPLSAFIVESSRNSIAFSVLGMLNAIAFQLYPISKWHTGLVCMK